MKKLVNAPLSNTIYWATVNEKKGTMNPDTRIDVTDNALSVVFEHITNMKDFNEKGFAGYEYSKKNSDDYATLCVFRSEDCVCMTKERYNELLEYEAMYKGLEK